MRRSGQKPLRCRAPLNQSPVIRKSCILLESQSQKPSCIESQSLSHADPASSYLLRQEAILLRFVKDISQVTLAAVLAVVHSSHEDTSSALLGRALPPQPLDLSVSINLVVLEDRQLGLLALVLDLLGGSVDLLLALLGTAAESEDEVERGLFLDVVVRQGAAVFELLAGEDQALLVRRDAFLVCATQSEMGRGN